MDSIKLMIITINLFLLQFLNLILLFHLLQFNFHELLQANLR